MQNLEIYIMRDFSKLAFVLRTFLWKEGRKMEWRNQVRSKGTTKENS